MKLGSNIEHRLGFRRFEFIVKLWHLPKVRQWQLNFLTCTIRAILLTL